MGIPFYFASLIKNDPSILENIETQIETDFLGIDLTCHAQFSRCLVIVFAPPIQDLTVSVNVMAHCLKGGFEYVKVHFFDVYRHSFY